MMIEKFLNIPNRISGGILQYMVIIVRDNTIREQSSHLLLQVSMIECLKKILKITRINEACAHISHF